jgi:hypothetical protein
MLFRLRVQANPETRVLFFGRGYVSERLRLMQDFMERRMRVWERFHDKHPLALGPLKTTELLKGFVRMEWEEYEKSLVVNRPERNPRPSGRGKRDN